MRSQRGALSRWLVGAILLGWLAPAPWLQILLLTLVLGADWLYGILTWFSFTHHDGASPAEACRRTDVNRVTGGANLSHHGFVT